MFIRRHILRKLIEKGWKKEIGSSSAGQLDLPSSKDDRFGILLEVVERTLRQETEWKWITIQACSKIKEKPPPSKPLSFSNAWSLNFSDNIRDYESMDLPMSKVHYLVEHCGLGDLKPEVDWLLCPSLSKEQFERLLGPEYFDNNPATQLLY